MNFEPFLNVNKIRFVQLVLANTVVYKNRKMACNVFPSTYAYIEVLCIRVV